MAFHFHPKWLRMTIIPANDPIKKLIIVKTINWKYGWRWNSSVKVNLGQFSWEYFEVVDPY